MTDASMVELLRVVRDGLPPSPSPARVVIVGAGMAGLVAAAELRRAGHEPVVLEARQRVGGRIETWREPFSDGLYAEAGAMRLPKTHELTMAYVERYDLRVSPFTMDNPDGYVFLHGQRFRAKEVDADPACLGFDLAEGERASSHSQLWAVALAPVVERLASRTEEAWAAIVAEYGGYSTREFLEASNWSEAAIERFGLLAQQEAILNESFLELLREEVGSCYADLVEIDGGMDHLPRAFLPGLRDQIRFGAKAIAIDQSPDGVTVHYQTGAGRFRAEGDYAILTVPFPVLRHLEALKPFSRDKQRAIRQLHYDASSKILLQFRRRFWEDDDGIFGGGTFTDMPIRAVYYPDHGRETGRGVLLASYTWGDDAQRWGSLSAHDRVVQALENLACIHPQAADEFEAGASKMWHDDEFAGGAFALFAPGQQELLHQHISAPEGRIHFAGEHTSLSHAWIQGAIESGLRTAGEVHERHRSRS
jgi:monoamine oxidase